MRHSLRSSVCLWTDQRGSGAQAPLWSRGSPVGRATVEEVRLVLWVTSGNQAAIALYRRCGFEPTGATRPVAHTPARTKHEMMRALDSAGAE